jgi:membrane associated rhomboid family serine protease
MFPIRTSIPVRYPPIATWTLIAINGFVFLIELMLSDSDLEQFLYTFALIPARYTSPELVGDGPLSLTDYLPYVTNMFLHGGWFHLIVNMWTLWLFGPAIEDRLGPGRYIAFYLACGILASITHAAFNPTSTVPALGASGAIAGVLGCHMRLFPSARVIVVFLVIFLPLFFDVPVLLFTGLWFLMQVLQATGALFMPSAGGGVAWWAHIGGFVAGLVFASSMRPARRREWPRYTDHGVMGFDMYGK